MLNVYVLEKTDGWKYDECIEQIIVAENEEGAIELASKETGIWEVTKKVDLNIEQILIKNVMDG